MSGIIAGGAAQNDIERLLFETGAVRVAPEDEPFWYTSGTIGPYYANTQNLIGGEAEAERLLGLIDAWLGGDRALLPGRLERYVTNALKESACYSAIEKYIGERLKDEAGDFDIVSGGERRDWFFSFITARALNKPHLTIFKDLSMVISPAPAANSQTLAANSQTLAANSQTLASDGPPPAAAVREGGLSGMRCLHVSDIVTEASSYRRAWAPALVRAGTRIHTSLTVLDRVQGGDAALKALGIRHLTLAKLDAGFFRRAYANNYINEQQYARLQEYIADPHGSMGAFLRRNPAFIEDALSAGGKRAERARMCVESGVYKAYIQGA